MANIKQSGGKAGTKSRLQVSIKTPAERPGSTRQRLISRLIWLYLNREFSDAKQQRLERFPKKGDTHQLRVTPWIRRVANDLGTLYREECERTATGIDPGFWDDYKAVLKKAGANRAWRVVNHHNVVLNQGYALILPVTSTVGDGTPFGVKILPIPMHDLFVEIGNPFLADDIRTLDAIEVQIGEDTNGLEAMSRIRITPTEAHWVEGPRKGLPLFAKDGSNPLNRIPLVAARAQLPAIGHFFVYVPEDMLHSQRAQDGGWTSLLHTAEVQGYSQPVFKVEDGPAGNPEDREVGMETAIKVRPNEDYKFESPSPDLKGYLEQVRAYIETETAMVGLSPATFLKSSSTTGVARMVEMWDRQQERLDPIESFQGLEQDAYEIIAGWYNAHHGREVWPLDASVKVNHVQGSPPSDPLHEIQALEKQMELGQIPPWEPLMRKYSLTEEEAKAKLTANILAYRALKAGRGGV